MDICKQSVVASPCTIIQQLCRVLCLETSFPETTPIPKSVISGKTCRTNQGTKIVEFKLQQEDGKRINTVRNIRWLVSIYSSDIFAVRTNQCLPLQLPQGLRLIPHYQPRSRGGPVRFCWKMSTCRRKSTHRDSLRLMSMDSVQDFQPFFTNHIHFLIFPRLGRGRTSLNDANLSLGRKRWLWLRIQYIYGSSFYNIQIFRVVSAALPQQAGRFQWSEG